MLKRMRFGAMRRARRKLDRASWGVNFGLASMALLAASACWSPMRPIPADQPLHREGPAGQGRTSRAGLDMEQPPESPGRAWDVHVGRGLLAPLLVTGPAVIATTADHKVSALDPSTGEPYWQRSLRGPILGGAVLGGERILVATSDVEGRVYALDARTGAQVWNYPAGATSHAPLYSDGAVFVASDDGFVTALDAESGTELWRTRLPRRAAAAPVEFGEHIIVAAQDTAFLLNRGGGEVGVRTALGASVSAPLALSGETAFVALRSGEVVALMLPWLTELWRVSLDGEPILAAPAVAPDGSLYVLTRAAEVWRFRSGAPPPDRVAALDGATDASLTLVRDGLLIGRLDGALFLLRYDGTVLWQHDLDESIRAPVAVSDGAVFVPLQTGQIVKLR